MESTGESTREGARAERIQVLYVAAESTAGDGIADALEREDRRFEATAVTSARAGLERLETTPVDCIVSECDLPGMDALSFLQAVRERDETLPFLLFPAAGSEELASRAISAGVTDYVQQGDGPTRYPVLATRIDAAVEATRTRRRQERHLRAIETAQEGISLLDPAGRFSYVNQSYADCFGYEPSDLLGEPWETLYDDEETAFIRDEVIPSVRDAGDWRGESNGVRADGESIVIDHTLSTTGHDELICTVRDISDRKERERDLERYETILEALGDPVYTVDAEGRYAFVNDAYAELTGYDKDEIVGEPISVLFDEPSVERGEDAVRTLLSDDTDVTKQTYEVTVETSDGGRIQCEDHVSLLPLEDGRYRGVAGVVRDISSRKERERELEQYETILRTIPDEVYVLDAEGRFEEVVPPIDSDRTTTGYPPEELVGEHVSVTIDDDDLSRGKSKIRELVRNDRERISFEIDLLTRDGERVPNENHIAVLPPGEDGAFRGTVGVLRDITERKERERELKRQNERLDAFASVVSHDLRNPLNVAQGQLELARQRCDENDHLEVVSQAHSRMQALIEDILTLAREDEPVTETNPVDLATMAGMCWRNVDTDGATLNAATDAVIRVDKSRFKRLLENLIRNAVEHGSRSDGGKGDESCDVTVTVGDLAGGGFYVEDDGPGIPADQRERIFESGYSTADEGTGFGLAIVEGIADAHGWSVTATEGANGGARFEFRGVEGC